MDIFFVSAPLRGAGPLDMSRVYANKNRADVVCDRLLNQYPDALILSPIHAYSFCSVLSSQNWVMAQCFKMLDIATHHWVFGDWESSEGCRMEVEYTRKAGRIPLLFVDEDFRSLACLAEDRAAVTRSPETP